MLYCFQLSIQRRLLGPSRKRPLHLKARSRLNRDQANTHRPSMLKGCFSSGASTVTVRPQKSDLNRDFSRQILFNRVSHTTHPPSSFFSTTTTITSLMSMILRNISTNHRYNTRCIPDLKITILIIRTASKMLIQIKAIFRILYRVYKVKPLH